MTRSARFSPVARVAAVLLALGSLAACGVGGAPEAASAAPSAPSDSGDEAVVRAWLDAINRRDHDAALALTADPVTLDQVTVAAADAVSATIETYCPLAIESIERFDDAYIVTATFSEDPDGRCAGGTPGSTGSFVIEASDGVVTRMP